MWIAGFNWVIMLIQYTAHNMRLILAGIILLFSSERARAQNNASKAFLKDLLEEMDGRIRPMTEDNGPVVVKVNFHVVSFSEISEVSMDYRTDIFFRESWRDPRLVFGHNGGPHQHISLPSKFVDQIWTPDLYFPNEKQAKFHDVTVPNKLLKVFPNGTVIYSVRLTLTLSCPMELAAFPLDKQTCALKVESYAYETHELQLVWQDPPVEIDDELELPQFELDSDNIRNMTCSKQYKATGRFPCLKVTFTLYRHFGFFLLQTYIPSILIIILSWVSFWINMDAVPARISLGVTTVLTMTTQLSGSKASIPKVSYPKAIDVWMSMGMVFVFTALVEYAFVNALSRKHSKQEARYKKTDIVAEKIELTDTNNVPTDDNTSHGLVIRKRVNYRNVAHKVDKYSRYVFPIVFVIFNLVYWPVYTADRAGH